MGGDEFAVLAVGEPSLSDLDALSERLERAFDAPFEVDGVSLSVAASIGRALWPQDTDAAEALMRKADAAMYRVKRGRATKR